MTELAVNGLKVIKSKDLICSNCNTCCRAYSKVDVNVTDIFQIADYLGLAPGEFFEKFCKVVTDPDDNWTFLFDIEGGCKFHKDGKCSIYPVRSDMCAFYPFSYTCLITSKSMKKLLSKYPSCFVHKLPDNLLIVPDIERMIDSRILFMINETYTAGHEPGFSADEAEPYHRRGLMMLKNQRMRDITYRKMLSEFFNDIPVDEETKQQLLTEADVKAVCDFARNTE